VNTKNTRISVIGLGYVGLPLALSFAKKFKVVGFDVSIKRIDALKKGFDETLEVSKKDILSSQIIFTNELQEIKGSNVFIVTVPTPVTIKNQPDLIFLEMACKSLAEVISPKSYIVFESTVFPGCTEDFCIPIIEEFSGLKLNKDFYVGFSPERINPGDKNNSFENINKVVSGSNNASLQFIAALYSSVVKADIFKAKSIKVAEASKIIENTQRDVNIALMNELSEIFYELDIKTKDVLEAASTKWNFHSYNPGLVGGHCIGVDPYYLAYKAKQVGVRPKMILSGRSTNNRVVQRIVNYVSNFLSQNPRCKKVFIAGITFKEDCPDLRNSGALKVIKSLNKIGVVPTIHDPFFKTDPHIDGLEYDYLANIRSVNFTPDVVLVLMPHFQYLNKLRKALLKLSESAGLVFDLKDSLGIKDSISL